MSSANSSQQQHPQAGQGRPLPKKEADLFKNLVKQYEGKQYKKAMKQADSILKKFPQHGETLAMKGLTLYYFSTARHEEAHGLVKSGLRYDMRSHVCWHVYGLLHRADRNYGEAIKCYKQALRIDKDNLQILRDLGLLQIQMRDLRGFVITRNSILSLKPTLQPNWLAFMLSKQLVGETEGALQVIDIYLDTLKTGSGESVELLERNYAPSELQLYKNGLMLSIGKWEDALSHLKDMEHCIVDRGTYWWNTATCLFHLERYDECLSTLNKLWERGMTEDYRLHAAYMCATLMSKASKGKDDADEMMNIKCREWWPENRKSRKQQLNDNNKAGGMDTPATTRILTKDQCQILLDLYRTELIPQYPKSLAMQRIPLTLMLQFVWMEKGENANVDWSQALEEYMKKRLSKGVPSLSHDLSSLLLADSSERASGKSGSPGDKYERLHDPVDILQHPQYQQILILLNGYLSNLEEYNQFTAVNEAAADSEASNDNNNKEPPSTKFWVWYCRAGWYELSGQYSLALEDLDRCIEHTPTAVDVYELRARILHKAGSLSQAVDSMDKGRSLDLQDRYMNNQTTRYLLWNNDPTTALERISLFLSAKDGAAVQTLYDMQCSWYELELAACLARKKEFGKALKQYAAVLSHFDDIHEDQFDFHSYCIRKVTLRAYADVLDWEDVLWNQTFYREAAEGTIKIFLHLHRNPPEQFVEPDYSGMTAAEKKKAKAIARKKKKAAEKKKQQQLEQQAALAKKNESNSSKNNNQHNASNKKKVHPTEQDIDGEEFLKKNALDECKKYSAILSKYAPSHLNTWLLQYDVSIERGPSKSLMALQALFQARKLLSGQQHPDVFKRTVDFCSRPIPNDQPEVVQQVLREQMPILLEKASSVSEYVNKAAAVEAKDMPLSMRIAVAQAMTKHCNKSTGEASKFLIKGGIEQVRGVTVDSCRDVLKALTEWNADASLIQEWNVTVKKAFPLLQETE